jgi:hypothetical protein
MSKSKLKIFNVQYVIPHTQELFTAKVLGTDYQKAEACLRSLICNQLKARGINTNYNSCIEVINRSAYCGIDLISDDTYEYFQDNKKVEL